MKHELDFEFEKETKGAVRYRELKTFVVGTLYIRKDALDGGKPEKLKVTIEG